MFWLLPCGNSFYISQQEFCSCSVIVSQQSVLSWKDLWKKSALETFPVSQSLQPPTGRTRFSLLEVAPCVSPAEDLSKYSQTWKYNLLTSQVWECILEHHSSAPSFFLFCLSFASFLFSTCPGIEGMSHCKEAFFGKQFPENLKFLQAVSFWSLKAYF